jgi:hypothetical protein
VSRLGPERPAPDPSRNKTAREVDKVVLHGTRPDATKGCGRASVYERSNEPSRCGCAFHRVQNETMPVEQQGALAALGLPDVEQVCEGADRNM